MSSVYDTRFRVNITEKVNNSRPLSVPLKHIFSVSPQKLYRIRKAKKSILHNLFPFNKFLQNSL